MSVNLGERRGAICGRSFRRSSLFQLQSHWRPRGVAADSPHVNVIINLSFCGFLNNIDEVVCLIKYLRTDGQVWRCLAALLDVRLHFHASGGGIWQPPKAPPPLLDRAFLKMQKSFAINSLLLLHS